MPRTPFFAAKVPRGIETRSRIWYNIGAMRILTRYVFREYLIPLVYCLGGFVSIYVLFELFGSFSRLMEAKLPFGMMVEYFCAYLAPYFSYLAPAALMLAALYTMWSFCRHSEIIAMRANGISFLAIVKPVLVVAVGMAIFVWWVNDSYVPRRAQWARQMKREKFDLQKVAKADDIVYRNSKEWRTWTIDKFLDENAEHLSGVRVTVDRPGGGVREMTITAPRADYLDGEWWFSNASVQHYNAQGEEVASVTPELDALPLRSFAQFHEEPIDFVMQNRDRAYDSIGDRMRYLRTHKDLSEQMRRKYQYDLWAKIFSPLACIVITLFAIPAGIASGRQSVFKGILGAIGMFFGFYGLTMGFMTCAYSGWVPPFIAALLPNLIFLILGIHAFHKQR